MHTHETNKNMHADPPMHIYAQATPAPPPPKQHLPTSKPFTPQAEQFPKNPSNPPTSRCDVYLFFNCKPQLGKSKAFNNQWMKIMVK